MTLEADQALIDTVYVAMVEHAKADPVALAERTFRLRLAFMAKPIEERREEVKALVSGPDGMTQREAAAALGVSQSTVRDYVAEPEYPTQPVSAEPEYPTQPIDYIDPPGPDPRLEWEAQARPLYAELTKALEAIKALCKEERYRYVMHLVSQKEQQRLRTLARTTAKAVSATFDLDILN